MQLVMTNYLVAGDYCRGKDFKVIQILRKVLYAEKLKEEAFNERGSKSVDTM